MRSKTTLADACRQIVDCEHKTAPIDPSGEHFVVGTPAMRGNTINLSESRRVSRETFEAWTRRLRPQHGDLLFAREAPVGPLVRIPPEENVAPGQRTVLLRPDPSVIDSDYLYYLLSSPLEQALIGAKASGSTVAHLNVADVRSFPLPPLPALAQQQGIAEVLGALDDKIAANIRKASIAGLLIEAMYQRAVGAPGTAIEPLMQVLNVAFGEPFAGAQFVAPGQGRPLIRIRDLKTFNSQVWTTESRPKEVLVQPGDVVVGMDAEFRPTWWLGKPGLLNQRVCRVTSDEAGSAFVREALRAPMGRIEGHKTGTTVIHLNKSDLLREHILWPVGDVRADFDCRAEPVLRALVAGAQERERLAAMRDALLPQLMSGKIKVKDAERVVEGVV